MTATPLTMRTLRVALPLVLLVAGPVYGGENAGRTLYLRYCASCHGRDGRGDGPVAAALGEKPTDLTRIAAAHGGEFPFGGVIDAIDGTLTVRAHGVSEMPVWGDVFQSDAASPLEQQILASGKILAITRYVRGLQEAAAPSH